MKHSSMNRDRHRDRGNATTAVIVGLVAAAILVAAGFTMAKLVKNPFSTETVDRSAPVVLTQLRDLSRFEAAEARFEVVIDQEKDVNLLPSFIAGERVQYVAVGSVTATVDFSSLDEDAITVEGDAVTFTLPPPTASDPVIDIDQSYVMNRDRGIADRIGGMFSDSPTDERNLILAAENKIASSAQATDLVTIAETNTTNMLTTMARAMGYETVNVTWEIPVVETTTSS